MKLASDIDRIQAEYGFHPIDNLLAPGIRMDDPKMVTPVIAEQDGRSLLLAREQETGNLAALGVPRSELRFFERYFSFDNVVNGSEAYPDLAEAVADLAAARPVTVGPDLPLGRYHQLARRVDVTVEDDATAPIPVVAYRLPRSAVEERFRQLRAEGPDVARRIVEQRPHLADLRDLFDADRDTRFQALDATLEELGVSAVAASAPPNLSELTGLRPRKGVVVVAPRNDDAVYLVAPDYDHTVPGVPLGRYPDLPAAVQSLGGGTTIAVEDGWMGVGEAQAWQDHGLELISATAALAKWREHRDHEDLAFAIVAAQATRYSIEGALGHAERALGAGEEVTERSIYRHALGLTHDFRKEFGIPFTIQPFFVNLHAANRSLYPAIPVEFAINDATRTVKFDAGLKVCVDGVVLGTSDMARTLVRTPEAKEAYDIFMHIVQDEVIPSLRPGTVLESAHRLCVDKVLEREEQLVDAGTMPPGVDLHTEYGRRNVGHLMGKQESFVTELRPGHTETLREGAIGAVEIQWPYGEYSIAAEDLWFAGPERTYVTSA